MVVSPLSSVHIFILTPKFLLFKRLFMVHYSLNGTNYISYRKIFATEYLIIKNDEIKAEEKIALIKDYLEKREYIKPHHTESLNQFFKEIAQNYIANKPRQSEMQLDIDRLFDEATNLV